MENPIVGPIETCTWGRGPVELDDVLVVVVAVLLRGALALVGVVLALGAALLTLALLDEGGAQEPSIPPIMFLNSSIMLPTLAAPAVVVVDEVDDLAVPAVGGGPWLMCISGPSSIPTTIG
jgi:hypothetical protein